MHGLDRMVLRVLVADDEQLARNELCFQLNQLDDVEVVEQAADGPQAVSLAETLAPDLVLLDIQMPGLTGFEVARQLLDRDVPSHVVFVTAFDQYAMEAFEVHAVDYLLKPVEPPRLSRAIERVRRLVTTSDPSNRTEANKELERIVEQRGHTRGIRHAEPGQPTATLSLVGTAPRLRGQCAVEDTGHARWHGRSGTGHSIQWTSRTG